MIQPKRKPKGLYKTALNLLYHKPDQLMVAGASGGMPEQQLDQKHHNDYNKCCFTT